MSFVSLIVVGIIGRAVKSSKTPKPWEDEENTVDN